MTDQEIISRMKMVRYYQSETKTIILIPFEELSDSCILAISPVSNQKVWIDKTDLPDFADPINKTLKKKIRFICKKLKEIGPHKNYKRWLISFRQDVNFEEEINFWFKLATVYNTLKNKHISKEKRKVLFSYILNILFVIKKFSPNVATADINKKLFKITF